MASPFEMINYDVKYLGQKHVIDELNPIIESGQFTLIDFHQLSSKVTEFILDTERGKRYVYEYIDSEDGKYYVLLLASSQILNADQVEAVIEHEMEKMVLEGKF